MQIASWLLVTSSLVTPAPKPGAATPAIVPAAQTIAYDDQQPRQNPLTPSSNTQTQSQTHQFGLGAAITMTNRGAGASMRYWFGEHVGVSMDTTWYRGGNYRSYSPTTGTTTSRSLGDSFQAAPAMMVLFGQANPKQVVSLRPYVGGGFSYSTVSSTVRTSSAIGQRGSGFGQQAFGGIEMSFADYPSLTISNEFTYYRLPSTSTTSSTIDGLNYLVAVHFYLK
jgi:hypothetical protein